MFKVNKGNSKLGSNIMVINLPAVVTCRPDAPCKKVCYANKGTFLFPNVKNCYANNLESFLSSPETAEMDILQQLPFMGFVRLHASGDFINYNYLDMIIRICKQLPNVKFMAYTKKYELFNDWLNEGRTIPNNLTIIFSLWDGFQCDNPYKFPTSQVILKKGNTDVILDGIECSGNCSKCYACWDLIEGENVLFNQH